MFDEYPLFLSVAQCCEILSVEKHSIYELIQSGKLKAIRGNTKIWRIPRTSLALYCLSESGITIEEETIDDYI